MSKGEKVDEDGTPKSYWRMKLMISSVSVVVALLVLISRVPRFLLEFEEWSGISVHEYFGMEAPVRDPPPVAADASPSADANPGPTVAPPAPRPSSDPTPSATSAPPPKPAPKPTPNRDKTFTVAFKVQGKTHTYWYGPEDADRSKRARTKLVANGLWSEFRSQAMMYDAPFDSETRLLVTQAMDANQDLHLTLDELTVGRRAGLLGLLGG